MTSQNLDSAAKTPLPYSLDYPPPDFIDPVIEVYKKDIDLASVRENLKLTMEERLRKAQARAVERAASHARLVELEEFHQFASRLLEATTEPLSLDEYLQLLRDSQERQSTIASIRQ